MHLSWWTAIRGWPCELTLTSNTCAGQTCHSPSSTTAFLSGERPRPPEVNRRVRRRVKSDSGQAMLPVLGRRGQGGGQIGRLACGPEVPRVKTFRPPVRPPPPEQPHESPATGQDRAESPAASPIPAKGQQVEQVDLLDEDLERVGELGCQRLIGVTIDPACRHRQNGGEAAEPTPQGIR